LNISEWYPTVAGRRVNSAGGILGECVALVQKYANEVLGVSGAPVFPVASAKDMVGSRPDAFNWVPNTPTGVPPYGSIVVFNGRVGGGYGHTGVAIEGSDVNQVRVIQQNDPYGSGASIKTYPYTNVSGWLVPKNNAGTPAGSGEDMINQGANEYARANKLHLQVRGRPLEKSVFDQFVGSSWLHFIEVLSDDKEADNWQENGKVGAIARRDRWDLQIYSLQDQLKKATDLVNTLNDRLVKSENTTKALTEKVDKLNAKVAELDNPDNIVVSRNWFNTLFDKIKSFISKG